MRAPGNEPVDEPASSLVFTLCSVLRALCGRSPRVAIPFVIGASKSGTGHRAQSIRAKVRVGSFPKAFGQDPERGAGACARK
ncbi:MAG: hypothetical protein ACPF1Y_02290 [Desulfobacterota bacterium U4-17]